MLLSKLQTESRIWLAHNFPGQPVHHGVLGVAEELGELALALSAVPAWRDDARILAHSPYGGEATDSIGDMVIFTVSFANAAGIDLPQAVVRAKAVKVLDPGDIEIEDFDEVKPDPCFESLVTRVGVFVHAQLKLEQRIRSSDEFDQGAITGAMLGQLAAFASALGISFSYAVAAAWGAVKERDWIKYPHDGRTR